MNIDQLYTEDLSQRFTEDISRQMRVPDRIGFSVGGAAGPGYQGYQPGSGFAAADMLVPEKILATGEPAAPTGLFGDSGRSGLATSPTASLGLGRFAGFEREEPVVIDSPPASITLDRVRYPDFQRQLNEDDDTLFSEATPSKPRYSGGSVADNSHSVAPVTGQVAAHPALHTQLTALQTRLDALEAENRQRRQLELLLYPAIGGFLLIRVAHWLFSSGSGNR